MLEEPRTGQGSEKRLYVCSKVVYFILQGLFKNRLYCNMKPTGLHEVQDFCERGYNSSMRYALFVSGLSLMACSLIPAAPKPLPDQLLLPRYEDLLPDGAAAPGLPASPEASADPNAEPRLRNVLEQLNVPFSEQNWLTLRRLVDTQPSGRWSRSQDFSEAENLQANFQRFGPLFNPPINSAENYRVRAVSFAEKASVPHYLDLDYFLTHQRILVAKWDTASGEFVVKQSDGSLVNYLLTQAVAPPRYLKVVF